MKISYLALGDSYTIGEGVPVDKNFPNLLKERFSKDGVTIEPLKIIAKTGWTTDELEAAIKEARSGGELASKYDIVTLLIGVNNQYRGWSIDAYAKEFQLLLKEAIHFAGNKKENVSVLSIPDWGVTPFAADRDRGSIEFQIDEFNNTNHQISRYYDVNYLDITNSTRRNASLKGYIVGDGLHPSELEYSEWADELYRYFRKRQ